mmetsp:Transcript_20995/g.70502  ORF Transcript_20995/g.70502 Transcript_20995/m.70502 type:complete len:286 (-) Transcript_20995:44-901(-)
MSGARSRPTRSTARSTRCPVSACSSATTSSTWPTDTPRWPSNAGRGSPPRPSRTRPSRTRRPPSRWMHAHRAARSWTASGAWSGASSRTRRPSWAGPRGTRGPRGRPCSRRCTTCATWPASGGRSSPRRSWRRRSALSWTYVPVSCAPQCSPGPRSAGGARAQRACPPPCPRCSGSSSTASTRPATSTAQRRRPPAPPSARARWTWRDCGRWLRSSRGRAAPDRVPAQGMAARRHLHWRPPTWTRCSPSCREQPSPNTRAQGASRADGQRVVSVLRDRETETPSK